MTRRRPRRCMRAALLSAAAVVSSSLASPLRIPEGMSHREYYGGFFPTEDWVESLTPIPRDERANPFQSIRRIDGPDPETRRPSGATVWMTEETLAQAQRQTEPYLALPPEALLGLVPRRNRISGNARVMRIRRAIPCPDGDGGSLTWRPDRPDEIQCSQGHPVDVVARFPPTGVHRVTGPLGDLQEYRYHDTPDGRMRIYVDGEFMDPLRVATLAATAEQMGLLFSLTGDLAYARRAAAILFDFSAALPHWPKVARGFFSGLEGADRLRPVSDFRIYSGLWYDKYHTGIRAEPLQLARAYDFVAAADGAWVELDALARDGNARAAVERDLFLYTLRDALRYDIRHPNPDSALSNYIPYQAEGLIAIGRATGLPEAVHYAAWKLRELARKTLMADGIFPESPSYARQHVGGMARAARLAEGYSDPPGFVSTIDGRRFDRFDTARELPELDRAVAVLESMVYPSGESITVHDTHSRLRSSGFPAPAETRPLLYPAWGHAILGRGQRDRRDAIQAHLHYSGNWGHDHLDMLNLILWAYEDELVSDIGYAHTYRRFANDTLGHNLVVVDRQPQRGDLRFPGRLVAWHPGTGGFQAVEADGQAAYDACSVYRRTLMLLPLGDDNLVLDIFLVEGGRIHEWMAQGSCMVDGSLEVSIPTAFFGESYADDGLPFEPPAHNAYLRQRREQGLHPHRYGPDETYPWYGVFRDVHKGRLSGPMIASFRYQAPTYPRLNAHVLQPAEADVYTATVPSLRRCWNPDLRREEQERVEQHRMPKLVIRRDGEHLSTRFVVLWEPVRGHRLVGAIRDLAPDDPHGVAIEIATLPEAGGQRLRVFYSADPTRTLHASDGSAFAGRYAVISEEAGQQRIEMVDPHRFSDRTLDVRVTARRALPLLRVLEEDGVPLLELDGTWPDVGEDQPWLFPEPVYATLSQDGCAGRVFPITAVETRGETTWLRCARHPGFDYEADTTTLRDVFSPFNETRGAAVVALPRSLTLTRTGDDERWHVQTTDPLLLNGRAFGRTAVEHRAPAGDADGF